MVFEFLFFFLFIPPVNPDPTDGDGAKRQAKD